MNATRADIWRLYAGRARAQKKLAEARGDKVSSLAWLNRECFYLRKLQPPQTQIQQFYGMQNVYGTIHHNPYGPNLGAQQLGFQSLLGGLAP